MLSNRKRKSFVGLRFKKSPHIESEPPPKRGNIKANEEEVKHVGINEETVTADCSYEIIQVEAFTMPHNFQDDWTNSGIGMTDGNSSDCKNERAFSNAARIMHDGVHKHSSDEELGISSGTETNAISAGSDMDAGYSALVKVYEDELAINERDEETMDSIDEEVVDINNIDDIDLNALSSRGVQACDNDILAQEHIFRRHHKKMKSFMPSHWPGRPKSLKARTLELKNALKVESRGRKEAERHVKELTRVKLSGGEWEKCLMDSCLSCNEEKLIINLMRLFKMGISKTKPVQLMVLHNLTSKLLKKNNNHYLAQIKTSAVCLKTRLHPQTIRY